MNEYETMFKEYPDVVTVNEIRKMLGIGRDKVYRLIREGKIKSIPNGRIIKVSKNAVIDYILGR